MIMIYAIPCGNTFTEYVKEKNGVIISPVTEF